MKRPEDIPADAIVTYTGKIVRPLDPDPETICIEDIAHSLANVCRYTGHTSKFYSVGQHSVIVSTIVGENRHDQLFGLMHDATEAYLSDLARPVKNQPGLGGTYRRAETKLWLAIAFKFCLPEKMPSIVKWADDEILNAEIRDLMPFDPYAPSKLKTIDPCMPPKAKRMFLERFEELK